jgi:hypothetical protein
MPLTQLVCTVTVIRCVIISSVGVVGVVGVIAVVGAVAVVRVIVVVGAIAVVGVIRVFGICVCIHIIGIVAERREIKRAFLDRFY